MGAAAENERAAVNLWRRLKEYRAGWTPPIWWLLWRWRREIEGRKFWVLMLAEDDRFDRGWMVGQSNLSPYEARHHLHPFTDGGVHIHRIEYGRLTSLDLAHLRRNGVSI